MRLRILVTGSRDWPDSRASVVEDEIAEVLATITTVGKPVLVHGGCPTGVDAIADRYWRRLAADGFVELPEVWPADWDRYGRRAGPIRNGEMVKAGASVVLGFPMGRSAGTRGCVRLAREAGLRVKVVEIAEEEVS